MLYGAHTIDAFFRKFVYKPGLLDKVYRSTLLNRSSHLNVMECAVVLVVVELIKRKM